MRTAYFAVIGFIALSVASCASKAQVTLADYYEANPGQAQMTADKRIKARTAKENKKRVAYYNSIQHR
jgi:hypothetical protein